MIKATKELETLIKARNTAVYVSTNEEPRAISFIRQTINEMNEKKGARQISVWSWTISSGLMTGDQKELIGEPLEALDSWNERTVKTPSILILPDFHPFMENPAVVRKFKEMSHALQSSYKSMIIVSAVTKIPPELTKEISLIDLEYPSLEEIKERVKIDLSGCPNCSKLIGDMTLEQKVEEISRAALGLTLMEVDDIIGRAAVVQKLSAKDTVEQKKQIIKKSGLLEYFDVSDFSLEHIGGLDLLKADIRRDKKRFSKKAQEYGLEPPKSRLCIGSPGTGKSLSVKAIAAELGLTLVRLAAGNISSQFYGQTTANMKSALKLALAISPCILWLDELEKMLSTGDGSGHEETMRALSEILTFMEESSGVYFVGTCNDYRPLKPELLQRFEKIDFVDLPNTRDRAEIFGIHLKQFKRAPESFNLVEMARVSEGFSGREIRIALKEALTTAFDSDRELETADVVKQLLRTTPTAKSRRAEIEDMRAWAGKNCLATSSPESEPVSTINSSEPEGNRFSHITGE